MATVHSFYLAPDAWQEPFLLTGPEAHHLDKVVRVKVNDTIRLFDGKGRHGTFTVTRKDKKNIELCPQRVLTEEPSRQRITIAAGYSKALRRSWFLEKAVELEAYAIWFWQGDFSQASLPEKEKNSWQATLVSAAKQCENPWLPEVSVLTNGVGELITLSADFSKVLFLYEGDTKGVLLDHEDLKTAGDILLIVGPEGGFSPREVELLQKAGIPAASLGKSVLRWETAAILTLGIAWWAKQSL